MNHGIDNFRYSKCDKRCELCDNFLCKGIELKYLQITVITVIISCFCGYLLYHLTK